MIPSQYYIIAKLLSIESYIKPETGESMSKPLSILGKYLNKPVIVELRGGKQYRGILDGFDPHLNLVLRSAEEMSEGKLVRKHDLAIVRGDNVIYISP